MKNYNNSEYSEGEYSIVIEKKRGPIGSYLSALNKRKAYNIFERIIQNLGLSSFVPQDYIMTEGIPPVKVYSVYQKIKEETPEVELKIISNSKADGTLPNDFKEIDDHYHYEKFNIEVEQDK